MVSDWYGGRDMDNQEVVPQAGPLEFRYSEGWYG